jgi:hypothetical protein
LSAVLADGFGFRALIVIAEVGNVERFGAHTRPRNGFYLRLCCGFVNGGLKQRAAKM